mmetsp:Transcript_24239/g.96151  ORF Transcript_24239/g.96151 Transcript_24239/m.96151 type:complete len:213 (-) Transcript_24239:64-702(-)
MAAPRNTRGGAPRPGGYRRRRRRSRRAAAHRRRATAPRRCSRAAPTSRPTGPGLRGTNCCRPTRRRRAPTTTPEQEVQFVRPPQPVPREPPRLGRRPLHRGREPPPRRSSDDRRRRRRRPRARPRPSSRRKGPQQPLVSVRRAPRPCRRHRGPLARTACWYSARRARRPTRRSPRRPPARGPPPSRPPSSRSPPRRRVVREDHRVTATTRPL